MSIQAETAKTIRTFRNFAFKIPRYKADKDYKLAVIRSVTFEIMGGIIIIFICGFIFFGR